MNYFCRMTLAVIIIGVITFHQEVVDAEMMHLESGGGTYQEAPPQIKSRTGPVYDSAYDFALQEAITAPLSSGQDIEFVVPARYRAIKQTLDSDAASDLVNSWGKAQEGFVRKVEQEVSALQERTNQEYETYERLTYEGKMAPDLRKEYQERISERIQRKENLENQWLGSEYKRDQKAGKVRAGWELNDIDRRVGEGQTIEHADEIWGLLQTNPNESAYKDMSQQDVRETFIEVFEQPQEIMNREEREKAFNNSVERNEQAKREAEELERQKAAMLRDAYQNLPNESQGSGFWDIMEIVGGAAVILGEQSLQQSLQQDKTNPGSEHFTHCAMIGGDQVCGNYNIQGNTIDATGTVNGELLHHTTGTYDVDSRELKYSSPLR